MYKSKILCKNQHLLCPQQIWPNYKDEDTKYDANIGARYHQINLLSINQSAILILIKYSNSQIWMPK